MRCFIAIDIQTDVLAAVTSVVDELSRETSLMTKDVKWVRPENMHLTLKFLGDIETELAESLCSGLKGVVSRHGCFDLTVSSVGSFGRPPVVVWAGIDRCEPLNRLQTDIENFLLKKGFPKEKKQFQAHLTLCRIKNQKAGRAISRAVAKYADRVFGTTTVAEVSVYESRLTSVGPVYTRIDSCMLA